MSIITDYEHSRSWVTMQTGEPLTIYSYILASKEQSSLINDYSQLVNHAYINTIGLFNRTS